MSKVSSSIESHQHFLFDDVRDEVVRGLTPERVLVVYLPRSKNELEIRSRFGVDEDLCLDTADVSLTLIRKTFKNGEPLSCLDAGDEETSDSLSAVLLGLRSVCLAPIIHPSGLKIGVLYADDRREVGRYQTPDAEWLAGIGATLGKKLSEVPRMVVSEPAAELMLPELPPDKDFTKSIAALARLSVTPKVENIESAAVQQILDSIEKHRETGGLRVARLQNELARIREQQSDLAAAERLLRECLETMRRAELGQTVEAVSFMNNLAGVLYRNDQAASAENTYLQALRLLNNDDPTYKARATPLLWNLGTLYDETGQFEQARAFLTSATELALDNWGAEDPRTQRCLKKLSKSQFSKVCEPSL